MFNAFDTPNAGGVQVSGRIAWEAIRDPGAGFDARALMISLEPATDEPADARVRRGSGRLGALAAARSIAGACDVALFWHLDLLKLMPFLRLGKSSRKAVFLHGTESWRRRGAITRRLLGRCDIVFANTAHTLNRATLVNPELGELPARVIHLGVGSSARSASQPDPVPAAVMVSRLHSGERYKGHSEVITAWPGVLQRVPEAQLWIVGDGDLMPDLEAAATAAGVGHAVRFFGRLPESEKEALIGRSRCLLLPSTHEGFGLVYLEAMRLGRPCLVGIDGGREVVNPPETGFSVTHRAPQEIADAVVRLLTVNDAWQKMSSAARARYEREFTARHFGARIVSALHEVAR